MQNFGYRLQLCCKWRLTFGPCNFHNNIIPFSFFIKSNLVVSLKTTLYVHHKNILRFHFEYYSKLLALKMWAVFLPHPVYGELLHYYLFLYKLCIQYYNNTIMNQDITNCLYALKIWFYWEHVSGWGMCSKTLVNAPANVKEMRAALKHSLSNRAGPFLHLASSQCVWDLLQGFLRFKDWTPPTFS